MRNKLSYTTCLDLFFPDKNVKFTILEFQKLTTLKISPCRFFLTCTKTFQNSHKQPSHQPSPPQSSICSSNIHGLIPRAIKHIRRYEEKLVCEREQQIYRHSLIFFILILPFSIIIHI